MKIYQDQNIVLCQEGKWTLRWHGDNRYSFGTTEQYASFIGLPDNQIGTLTEVSEELRYWHKNGRGSEFPAIQAMVPMASAFLSVLAHEQQRMARFPADNRCYQVDNGHLLRLKETDFGVAYLCISEAGNKVTPGFINSDRLSSRPNNILAAARDAAMQELGLVPDQLRSVDWDEFSFKWNEDRQLESAVSAEPELDEDEWER